MRARRLFWIILVLTAVAAVVDLPREYRVNFKLGPVAVDRVISRPEVDWSLGKVSIKRNLDTKLGLDLAGGSQLLFEADMNGVAEGDREKALEAARANIERRVNLFGVSEPVVQTVRQGENWRLVVELPGVKDVNTAISLIGQTAQLVFYELFEVPGEKGPSTDSTGSPQAGSGQQATASAKLTATALTGKDLTRAEVQFDNQSGKPIVALRFNSDGTKLFGEITTRNVGKQVPIVLDGRLVSSPVVQEAITTGEAVIRGEFSLDEAKNLVMQLNAGALPVPVRLAGQNTVGPTLGEESVERSVRAGLVGLAAVLLFMGIYYGRLGVIADLGLVIYGLLTLALYKLIPVVLTLPGIAGFILSVGMAVDSNILIFERFSEEMREGKPWRVAMELGFGRAWDSIRDANISTLITCFVLFNPFDWTFLNRSGAVRGFALTLALGIFISLFTGIVVTRTLLRVLYQEKSSLAGATEDRGGNK